MCILHLEFENVHFAQTKQTHGGHNVHQPFSQSGRDRSRVSLEERWREIERSRVERIHSSLHDRRRRSDHGAHELLEHVAVLVRGPVDPKNGSYASQWEQDLQAIVLERVLGPVRSSVKNLAIEDVVLAHGELETVVKEALTGAANPLLARGIQVESCSVDRIEAEDEDVASSIGAKEREEMLSAADKATHERRIAAATNEHAVQTYEAKTKLELEKERANLIKKQGENKKTEAQADADATKIRLVPMSEVEPGKLLAAAYLCGVLAKLGGKLDFC